LKQNGCHTGEVLDVRSLGAFKPQNFVVEETVFGLQFLIDCVKTFEFG